MRQLNIGAYLITNAENKILEYVQILAASKNQADWEIPAFTKNHADWEILAFTENQADWEIPAFTKNQADWEILAFTKNQADDRILAGVEIPAPGEKPAFVEKLAKLEKHAACLLFRLGGISSCWLLPGLADEHVQILVDVMNLACSLQVRRKLRLPRFYGRPSPVLYRLFVPARHAKKCLKSTRQPKIGLLPGILPVLSNHKIPNSAYMGRIIGGGVSLSYLSTRAGCRSAGSLGLHAWWHPF